MAPDPDGYPGIPRWVKITGIIVVALVILFVVAQALGLGGEHGPSRHVGP